MISPDIVENIGIVAEISDRVSSYYGVGGSLHSFFSKEVDEINIGKVKLKDIKLDFGIIDPQGEINGLLGLDLLMKLGAILDLKRLVLTVDG
ncbi:MAG: aspartyl protease family protein [Clostridia bacterium]|nr:aspartyl protease family protein [Clostridia bacterium]